MIEVSAERKRELKDIELRGLSIEMIKMIGNVARGNIALHEAKLREDAELLEMLTSEVKRRRG